MERECSEILPDIVKINPHFFEDKRGYFIESYSPILYGEMNFIQTNISFSKKNVLRGLHYQVAPTKQGKLITCLSGKIWDVAVDMRFRSRTNGKWSGFILNGYKKEQVWIPEGFAHGFYTLSKEATIMYQTTNVYSPKDERTMLWNDERLHIDWKLKGETPIVSEKDSKGKLFNDLMLELV